MPKSESRQEKTSLDRFARTSCIYCGLGLFIGDAARAGVALITGDAFAAGDDLGEDDGFGDTEAFGVGDDVAVGCGFLTGTVAEATSCHCPLRRAKVSTDRNS